MSDRDRYRAGSLCVEQEHSGDLLSNGCELADGDSCPWVAKLPHQCDAWVIGGEAELCQLIRDAERAIQDIREVTTRQALQRLSGGS
jgi:hypothetical protein